MFNRKGQNIAEYSILIALVIAAAVAMQVYIKRGIQGRIADATDAKPTATDVGGGQLTFDTNQYEPYYLESSGNVFSNRAYNEDITQNAGVERDVLENTVRANQSYEKSAYNADYVR